MKKNIISLFVLVFSGHCFTQLDTLTIVSYNLLNFPDGRNDCGASNINPLNRTDTLRKIVTYLKPDIFLACEIQSKAGADSILTRSLNVFGANNYQMAPFQYSIGGGGALNNALYFNSDKLGFLKQKPILTSSRDISHYTLYVLDQNLSLHRDTVFLEVCMAHLKAGNTTADAQTRATQTEVFRQYIDAKPLMRNYLIAGDMNVYKSNESCYQNLITGGSKPFFDPISSPGNWNNNGTFAALHTQSPRTSGSYACGATGGLDDRFDQILVTENVLNGSNRVKYVASSYKAVGNDGLHFNSNLLAAPFSNLYPDSIIRALYYQSDHLPVMMKMAVNLPTANGLGLTYIQNGPICEGSTDGEATVSAMYGVPPFAYSWDSSAGNQTTATATNLLPGSYCVIVTDAVNLTDTVCFEIEAKPNLNASVFPPSTASGCNGQATVLVSGGSGMYTFLWSDSLMQTTQTAVNLCPGNYTCTVSDAGNCELVLAVQLFAVNQLLEMSLERQELFIAPNPVGDLLELHNKSVSNFSFDKLIIRNPQGLEIRKIENESLVSKAKLTINTSDLSQGIYFLEVHHQNESAVLKFRK